MRDVYNNLLIRLAPDGTQTVMGSATAANGVAIDANENLFVTEARANDMLKFQPPSGNFGNVNVCLAGQACGQSLSLSYNVTGSGTLGTPNVLTEGTSNLDFSLGAGSTCTGAVTGGSTCTVNVTFAPRLAGLRRGAVQVTDSSGKVLATTYVYGNGVGPEIAFGGGIPITVASKLGNLAGTAVDGAGNVFLADTANRRVLKIAANGAQSTVGTGLSQPVGVAVDAAGNAFIADTSATSIIEVPATGGPQIKVGSGLYFPSGVAVDGAGDLYIADTENGRVLKVFPNGTQTPIGSGWIKPAAVAVDAAGNVWVADLDQTPLVKVAADGTQTLAGTGLNQPCGVAIDAAGDVLITNRRGNVVEIYADGSQATLSSALNSTTGVAVDGAGDIFIAESNGNLVEVQRSQPPTLNFPSTPFGNTSSPQSAAIENIGNASLSISSLSIGLNFGQVPGSGSPVDCAASSSLVPGASCNLSIVFAPTAAGALQSTAVLADNSLNGSPATQTVTLNGVGQQASQTISFTLPATASVLDSITLTASASSGLPVSFASTTNGVCTVSGTTASMAGVGICSIQATQAGNAKYSAATPVSQTITVSPAGGFTITPTPGSETVYPGTSAAGYMLKLQSVNGFSGNVTLSCSGSITPSVCGDLPQTLNVSGTAYAFTGILFPASTKAGTYTITFKGVSGSTTSSATATFTVEAK